MIQARLCPIAPLCGVAHLLPSTSEQCWLQPLGDWRARFFPAWHSQNQTKSLLQYGVEATRSWLDGYVIRSGLWTPGSTIVSTCSLFVFFSFPSSGMHTTLPPAYALLPKTRHLHTCAHMRSHKKKVTTDNGRCASGCTLVQGCKTIWSNTTKILILFQGS